VQGHTRDRAPAIGWERWLVPVLATTGLVLGLRATGAGLLVGEEDLLSSKRSHGESSALAGIGRAISGSATGDGVVVRRVFRAEGAGPN
jgi:hypothetical protein